MQKKKQIIEVDGHYVNLDQGMNIFQNVIVSTDTMIDRPDQNRMISAKQLLMKLMNSDLLSDKTKAIIAYDRALTNLYQHTVDEGIKQ